jgi:hypothetical protein
MCLPCLQPTALVHEASLHLLGDAGGHEWDSHCHFFAAAAEARRRLLVENARCQARQKEFLAWFVPKKRIVLWPCYGWLIERHARIRR